MFLFILESIGTSELILIGIIALIFLGPRKLPQIAKTIGKTMADFRNTTSEFKSTWEREVNFEEEARALETGELAPSEPATVARTNAIQNNPDAYLEAPSIKAAQPDLFANSRIQEDRDEPVEVASDETSDKRTWL